VNCPKCGYEQEERLDCRKCGVVFSKYIAMQTEASATPGSHVPGENGAPIEILELRQNIRDLNRRFSEVEFERVERSQIKGELKLLDKKVQTSSEQISQRLEDLEKLLSSPQAPPPPPDGAVFAQVQQEILEANVDPLARRLSRVEETLERWERELLQRNSLSEEISDIKEAVIEPLAGRLNDAEAKLQRWEKELLQPKDSLTAEILGRFEVRLTDLEGRIASLSVPGPGAELSSAFHDLQNRLRLLGDDLAAVKISADRIPSFQQDIAEVRGEVGKIWAQIQEIETKISRPPAPAVEPSTGDRLDMDIRSIRDSLQEIREFIIRTAAKP
jgi:DNA repair exonuclease SbcCD ATPase subunit